MNIQIRGSGTAIEFRRLTEEQYRYWSNEGEAAIKRHLDGDDCVCPDSLAVTSTAEADHASLVGPCPYSAMMYVTGDAGGDIEIDLADLMDDYPEKLIHCREADPDPIPHLQRTRELDGTFCEADFAGDDFVWDKLSVGMTYFDGAYMIDRVEYDGVALEIEMPEVTSDCIVFKSGTAPR